MKTRILKHSSQIASCKTTSSKQLSITFLRTSKENAKSNGRHGGSCWTVIIFSSKVINFGYFSQTSTTTKLFIKVQIWLVQSLGFKVQSLRLSTINSKLLLRMWFRRFDTLLSHFDLLVCYIFLILFYIKDSRIDVFVSDTDYFLAPHSVSNSLHQKTFSLMVASNCQLFYLSWSLRKLSYANVKESYSRRTTTVIVNVTVLTKVLSFS